MDGCPLRRRRAKVMAEGVWRPEMVVVQRQKWFIVIAVAGLVLVGGGIIATMLLLRPAVPSEAVPKSEVEGAGSETDPAHGAAKEELQSAFEERKQALPPETAEPLARDLNLIESAIAEIGAALANDPDNESLKQMLVATYRNELKLLKRALRIAGDDREGYVDD